MCVHACQLVHACVSVCVCMSARGWVYVRMYVCVHQPTGPTQEMITCVCAHMAFMEGASFTSAMITGTSGQPSSGEAYR